MFRWVDHTGEMELEIRAPDEATVFRDAVAALAELLDDEQPGERRHERLEVSAPDRATLLAECLGELVFRAETEGFVPERMSDVRLEPQGLTATVEGHAGHPIPLVKAVTYHRLSFERDPQRGWVAGVVFDV